MLANTTDCIKKREILKIKRRLLFEEYTSHPNDFHFALEIKTIDDEIADFTRKIADFTHKIDQERGNPETTRPLADGRVPRLSQT